MKRIILLVMTLALPLSIASQCFAADTVKEGLIARALDAMAYTSSFKQGVAMVKKQSGKTSPFIEAVLSTSNEQLSEIIAHVYAKYLTRKQAEELDNFYESPTGKALTSQEASDASNPHPQINLTPKQMAKAQAFSDSSTAAAFTKITRDKGIWREVGQAIVLRLRPPAR